MTYEISYSVMQRLGHQRLFALVRFLSKRGIGLAVTPVEGTEADSLEAHRRLHSFLKGEEAWGEVDSFLTAWGGREFKLTTEETLAIGKRLRRRGDRLAGEAARDGVPARFSRRQRPDGGPLRSKRSTYSV